MHRQQIKTLFMAATIPPSLKINYTLLPYSCQSQHLCLHSPTLSALTTHYPNVNHHTHVSRSQHQPQAILLFKSMNPCLSYSIFDFYHHICIHVHYPVLISTVHISDIPTLNIYNISLPLYYPNFQSTMQMCLSPYLSLIHI